MPVRSFSFDRLLKTVQKIRDIERTRNGKLDVAFGKLRIGDAKTSQIAAPRGGRPEADSCEDLGGDPAA